MNEAHVPPFIAHYLTHNQQVRKTSGCKRKDDGADVTLATDTRVTVMDDVTDSL